MDRINADLLRTFIEVARLEHLGRAADALQSDQSTVSRKIARLEHEIGVPLFERIGRSIRLTKAGQRFVGRADRILSEMRDAVAEAAGTVSAETGEVHLGFLHTVGARWLPERLARFLDQYPGVRFTLEEGTSGEVVAGLLDGRSTSASSDRLPPTPRRSRWCPSSASASRSWSRSSTAWSAGRR